MLVNQALSLNAAALKASFFTLGRLTAPSYRSLFYACISPNRPQHNKTSSQYGYSAIETDDDDTGFEKLAFLSSAKILSSAIEDCDENSLCTALDCLSATSTTLRVYERFEQSVVQESSSTSVSGSGAIAAAHGSLGQSQQSTTPIFKAAIPSDGLLMQQEASIPLLSAYCMHELQRRSEITKSDLFSATKKPRSNSASGANNSKMLIKPTTTVSSGGVERLVEYFQKTENHMLALQVLSQSWVLDVTKAQLLRASLVALCRKLLTYRDINYDYAVACLSCLPMDLMFHELKSAVPTIQSDFSRLHVVALIGEELSYLWGHERQLELFQGLQSHAKWWHLLSSIGLKVDMKAFQHPDLPIREQYVQSLIPQILQKSHLNLELTLDYCRSFDVHPEKASLQYIELMLSLPPSSDVAQEHLWSTKIAAAAAGLDESQLTTTLYRCLLQIHALDYERILHICHWIVNLAPGQVDDFEEDEQDGVDRNDVDTDNDESLDSIENAENRENRSPAAQKHSVPRSELIQKPRRRKVKLSKKDIDTCRNYIDTIQYLSTLSFPAECIDLLKAHEQGSMRACYAQLKGHFAVRIPFWMLTADPWSVLGPVLTTASPTLMEKLLPLCFLLGIDKEEFTARCLHSMFQVKKRTNNNHSNSHQSGLTQINDEGRQEIKKQFVALVNERALLYSTKLKVWRLVFDSEVAVDKDYAIFALQRALAVIRSVDDAHVVASLQDTKASLDFELKKLQVNDRIQALVTACAFPEWHARVFSYIDRPTLLVTKVVEMIVEHAWSLQCQQQQQAQSKMASELEVLGATGHGVQITLPTIRVTQTPAILVLRFLQQVLPALHELTSLLEANDSGATNSACHGGGSPATSTSTTTTITSLLDLVSHELVSRFLTEGSQQAGSNNSGNSGNNSSGNNNSTGASSGSSADVTAGHGLNTNSTTSLDSGGGFWKRDRLHMGYAPSDAEWRRREDEFLAFGLIVVLVLQVNDERRYV